jgi:hypothetical protein
MEANPTRVIRYFDGTQQCMVPLYQRPYSWERREWEQLWDDVLVCYNSFADQSGSMAANHFMGAVVTVPTRTNPVGVNKSVVIDGQQRLSTLSILIALLRDRANGDEKEKLQDYLVNRHYKGLDHFKLLPTQKDRKAYAAIVKAETHDPSHLMTAAYEFFAKKFDRAIDDNGVSLEPVTLFNAIQESLWVVYINLTDSDDPYLIFESLNAKGRPLTAADLIRNYLLMRFRAGTDEDNAQDRIYAEIWQPLEHAVENARADGGLTDFFRYYESGSVGEAVTQRNLYAVLKKRLGAINAEAELAAELQRMRRFAGYFEIICNPEREDDPRVRQHLSTLQRLRINVQQPLVLTLCEIRALRRIDSQEMALCLQAIISMLVRRSLLAEGISGLNKRFPRLARDLLRESAGGTRIGEWLVSELDRGSRSEGWPGDEQFQAALRLNDVYSRKDGLTRVLLEGIEQHLAGKEFAIPEASVTIEHIVPQTIGEDWKRSLGPDWERVHREWVNRLANLTLTGFNSELGNGGFTSKQMLYRTSIFRMNAEIAAARDWTEAELAKRAGQLGEIAVKVWPHASEFRRALTR